MDHIKKTMVINEDAYYKQHLMIITGLMPVKLTKLEISILAELLKNNHIVLTSSIRKSVMKNLTLSRCSLSVHLTNMINKGYLFKNKNNSIEIKSYIIPQKKQQVYIFKIVNDDFKTTPVST